MQASEVHPRGLYQVLNIMEKTWSPRVFKFTRKRGKCFDFSKSDEDICAMWSSVLRHYTGTKLAVLSGKLAANFGIARGMQSHLEGKNTYLAGLWAKNLARNLLWGMVSNMQNSQQSEYRAPTWS
jgi:hypothetical protein